VYPAITVLEALKLAKENVLWVGSRGGMEESLVTRLEIPYKTISAAGIHGVGLFRLPGNIYKLIKGFFESMKLVKQFQPDVLFFTGGFLAFPMALASLRKPSVVYVPDIEPGLALKALARFADKITLTTEKSSAYFPNQSKLTVTGYPVRPDLNKWSREDALDYFNFDPSLLTLAIVGGSKGARSINNAVMAMLPELLDEMQVIHLCGHLDWEKVEENARQLSPEREKRYHVYPYLHEIGAVFTAADLVVSRAGASTLGEYPLFGVPAILVPYPYAWRYQQVNAQYLENHGAAVIIRDEDLEEQLFSTILTLISDEKALSKMHEAMKSLAMPNAAQNIADRINELVRCSTGGETA
jgi:UDP-N-acetylglucosamine--N-acetylmuramyl-(pentapeptide) pyrophosphoryl-undecaprenol N-acetylglucosamine transferase